VKPSKQYLYDLYVIEKKTMKEIGKDLGVDRHKISKWIKEYDIKIRKYRSNSPIPPKDDLLKLYTEDMKSIKDICKVYNVGIKAVKKWFKEYNIETINVFQKKYYKVRKKPFNKKQRSLIIGTLLGDSSMTHGKSKRISMSHCEKQLDYLKWKKEILGDFAPKIIENEKWKWNSKMYSLYSICHQDFNPIHDLFYVNNKKVIKPKLANFMDALALAVWFMDDGSSKKNKHGITYCSKISTEGFTEKENKILQDIIFVRFNIRCKVCEYNSRGKKYNYLSFNKKNSIKLTKIIEPYVVDCMKYKLVYDNRSSETECQTP
jgi:transposase